MNTQQFIIECEGFRPQLRSEPSFEKFATLFGMWKLFNILDKPDHVVMPETLADACAELIPEQREFWLRVEATMRDRFVGGLTALMSGPAEDAP